jgi:hypothetical protein
MIKRGKLRNRQNCVFIDENKVNFFFAFHFIFVLYLNIIMTRFEQNLVDLDNFS